MTRLLLVNNMYITFAQNPTESCHLIYFLLLLNGRDAIILVYASIFTILFSITNFYEIIDG